MKIEFEEGSGSGSGSGRKGSGSGSGRRGKGSKGKGKGKRKGKGKGKRKGNLLAVPNDNEDNDLFNIQSRESKDPDESNTAENQIHSGVSFAEGSNAVSKKGSLANSVGKQASILKKQ